MRSRPNPPRFLPILAATAACVLIGCSDAGSGGPAGLEAVSSQDGGAVVGLQGQVVDHETRAALARVRVTGGGATTWTDEAGRFSLTVEPDAELTFSGAGYYDRVTVPDGFSATYSLVPRSFDMTSFNDVARDHSAGTLRWTSAPDVYVDVRGHSFAPGQSVPAAWVDQVAALAPGFVASWTGGALATRSVTVGSAPPPAGTPGVIVIAFDEDPAHYPNATAAGSAIASWDAQGVIRYATVRFRFSHLTGDAASFSRQAVIGHELGHALGMAHMDGGVPSMMAAIIRTPELTVFDRAAGRLLYDRRPGNRADDRESGVGLRGIATLASR
jgi:hypothetical protein